MEFRLPAPSMQQNRTQKPTTMKTFFCCMLTALFSVLLPLSARCDTRPTNVCGTVTDPDGRPLQNVSVRTPSSGTVTDRKGYYSLHGIAAGTTLTFSRAGYATRRIEVVSSVLNVKLEPQTECKAEETAEEELLCAEPARGNMKLARKTEVFRAAADCAGPVGCRPCPGSIVSGRSDAETYGTIVENRFLVTETHPLSTFSIDVDGASYSNLRRMINTGTLPPADAVRTEELVNYFPYRYDAPKNGEPVSLNVEAGTCPWNRAHRLVRIGLKAKEIDTKELPASNLVFLLDVSGSMAGPGRLGLVVSSMKLLVDNLRAEDRVAIVTYSNTARTVLPSTPGDRKQTIREALDGLEASGATAGGAGLRTAYAIARENFIAGGNNRIVLCSDGDFNVGPSDPQELERLVVRERQSGVFLTVLGYGMGNYKDLTMQTLSEKGNGNHAYIDNLQEAKRVLVGEFGSTMHTVAKDVKLQIEFNPAEVRSYRLIGYESRLLHDEDFNDDTRDAGEIGAGHCVTALYEIVPADVQGPVPGSVDPLKYRPAPLPAGPVGPAATETLTVKIRYKAPDGEVSRKIERAFTDRGGDDVSSDFRFASAVAMFGQLLRDSDFKGTATYGDVIATARLGLGDDPQGYRREFIRLVETTEGLQR